MRQLHGLVHLVLDLGHVLGTADPGGHDERAFLAGLNAVLWQHHELNGPQQLHEVTPVCAPVGLLLVSIVLKHAVHLAEEAADLLYAPQQDWAQVAGMLLVAEVGLHGQHDSDVELWALGSLDLGKVAGAAAIMQTELVLAPATIAPRDGLGFLGELYRDAVFHLSQPQQTPQASAVRCPDLATALVAPEHKGHDVLLLEDVLVQLLDGKAGTQRQAHPTVRQLCGEARILRVDTNEPRLRELFHHRLELISHGGHRKAGADLNTSDPDAVPVRPCLQMLEPGVISAELGAAAGLGEARVATEHLHVGPRHRLALGAGWQDAPHPVRDLVLHKPQVLGCLPDIRAARLGALQPPHCAVDL
mmetsp:Transcript_38044/g.120904  ORF Transcript_38044/g.120904 Transcript_38044/m.120904 type:complete len:360 (-) Transcript_38044:906-1985(-)